tara:strand:- start:473 stop:787 length:315 start_codon:yes stop_codon:yes gene_type:complete
MKKNKRDNLKKKDISNDICLKSGVSFSYASKFLEDTIEVLIAGLKKDRILKINKFGSFTILSKKERIGRNPKNNDLHEIKKRKIVSFKASSFLKQKVNQDEQIR